MKYRSSNELNSQPGVTYSYDANGNLISRTDASGTTSYAWDVENRLASVTLPAGGGTVSYQYDPFGRRIEKVSPTGTTIYAYDGDNVVEELDGGGTAVARYTQGLGIDEPLAMYRGGASYYYNADGLGSITSLTDASGQIAASYTYDSFGKLTASTGTITNPMRYTGREYDTATGLYYYRARYYDSSVGRFISEDAARFGGGTNFYEYAGNTPTIFVDPTGNCPIDLDKFVNWLDKHANAHSIGRCARYIRLGLEEGHANTKGSPVPAKDWGSFLEKNLGFSQVQQGDRYTPVRGDVAVFQPVYGDRPSSPYGHIEVWDGTEWVSDYKQGIPSPNGLHFYPNLGKYGRQPYKVYRCK